MYSIFIELKHFILAEKGSSANRVDPDKMALHCLPFCHYFLTETLRSTMDVSKLKDGIVHVRNSGMKGLKSTKLLIKAIGIINSVRLPPTPRPHPLPPEKKM